MGTRARVDVIKHDKIVVTLYRQFDGYPSGLGQDIVDFAKDMRIINGISDEQAGEAANGMGCFAAQLVAHLKGGEIGNVYLRHSGPESHGEEFSYTLTGRDGRIWMEIHEGSMTAFGLPGDTKEQMSPVWAGFLSDFTDPYAEEGSEEDDLAIPA